MLWFFVNRRSTDLRVACDLERLINRTEEILNDGRRVIAHKHFSLGLSSSNGRGAWSFKGSHNTEWTWIIPVSI